MKNFESLTNKVINALNDVPESRDSDYKLVALIWSDEVKCGTSKEFLFHLSEGNLSHFERIRRIIQKIQEEFTSLRGKNYQKRHKSQYGFMSKIKSIVNK